jgi:hypothetical protein
MRRIGMKLFATGLLALGFATSSMAEEITIAFNGDLQSCNWGQLTYENIANGFEQGPHASDPGGDGRGSNDNDNPRVGLANVVELGNLDATCNFIREQFDF